MCPGQLMPIKRSHSRKGIAEEKDAHIRSSQQQLSPRRIGEVICAISPKGSGEQFHTLHVTCQNFIV